MIYIYFCEVVQTPLLAVSVRKSKSGEEPREPYMQALRWGIFTVHINS